MGNDQNAQKSKLKLIDYKIPQNFYQNCHPNMLDLNIDQKQHHLLSAYILISSQVQNWRNFVQPLLQTKYILTPYRITTSEFVYDNVGCTPKPSDSIDRLSKIAYQPFIYSLNHEITARKQRKGFFNEQQIWKLMKYLTKGLIEWHLIYPLQNIKTIMPENIVINFKGNIRIVSQYSFPKDTYLHKSKQLYESPQNRTNSVIKYEHTEPNKYKVLSGDLYSIGVTLINCMLLQRNQLPSFAGMKQKLGFLEQNLEEIYSRQLKNIIFILLQEDYKKRPNPHDLIDLAEINQNKFS